MPSIDTSHPVSSPLYPISVATSAPTTGPRPVAPSRESPKRSTQPWVPSSLRPRLQAWLLKPRRPRRRLPVRQLVPLHRHPQAQHRFASQPCHHHRPRPSHKAHHRHHLPARRRPSAQARRLRQCHLRHPCQLPVAYLWHHPPACDPQTNHLLLPSARMASHRRLHRRLRWVHPRHPSPRQRLHRMLAATVRPPLPSALLWLPLWPVATSGPASRRVRMVQVVACRCRFHLPPLRWRCHHPHPCWVLPRAASRLRRP